jgi:outer membrane usher protein
MTLMHNGKPVPFGATVSQKAGNSTIVGDDGQAYLAGLPLSGMLEVQWGESRTALRGEISTSGKREAAAGE